jgi:hypothetical protein
MRTLDNTPVSLFRGTTDAHPFQTVTIGAVLEAIQTGIYSALIEQLRGLRTTQGQAAYNVAKLRLDAVTFGGTFDPRVPKTISCDIVALCTGIWIISLTSTPSSGHSVRTPLPPTASSRPAGTG